jgi:ubiquinone/menaquinone biosynthesis C-methylase UbiE
MAVATTLRAAVADTYEGHWNATTVSDAMKLIVVNDDESFFEDSGKDAAGPIITFLRNDSVVLDLGSGIGRIAKHVAPHCARLLLADISPAMLEMAVERLAGFDNISVTQAAATSVPDVADATIDLVYSVLVLQHLEREDAFLMVRDVRRMLKPGGIAYLTFPNLLYDGYLASFIQYAESGEVANKARARFYTPSEVERVTLAAGFESVELREAPDIVAICR